MHKPSALLAAIAFFVALSFVASCGQPEPWEPTADREARAIDRLLWLLEPSEAHAQLFPSTLTDTLRLGKGRYRLIQVESAQNLLVEKFYLGPTSTRPNCNAARSGLFHINASRQVSYCNATAWVPIGGVLRQATPPTCSDSQPVRLYEDSDDDGLYRCVGTTWTRMADDADGDGFNTFVDADDADDAVYARNLTAAVVRAGTGIGPSGDLILTGTLRYETQVTYTGSDLENTKDSGTARIGAKTSDQAQCNAFAHCAFKGDLREVSWTTETQTGGFLWNYLMCTTSAGPDDVAEVLDGSGYELSSTTPGLRFASLTCQRIDG